MVLEAILTEGPTVAAINGHAYAGGLITALGCDYRIAQEGALEFSLNEVPIGISFGRSTGWSAPRRLSLTLFSKVYDLGAALKIGVIGKTAAPGRPPDEAGA